MSSNEAPVRTPCSDPDHEPPKNFSTPPGDHKHVCPTCGKEYDLTVSVFSAVDDAGKETGKVHVFEMIGPVSCSPPRPHPTRPGMTAFDFTFGREKKS